MRETILIVTAAGLGKRIKEYSLKKYGNYVDKPLIELKNKKLLEWSIKPFYPLITTGILKFNDIYVVIRSDQDIEAFKKACGKINPRVNVVLIDKLTRGPAHTTYEACKKISQIKNIQNHTIIVSDSDHTFRCDNLLNFFKDTKRESFNSFCILKKVSNPEKWGYVIKTNSSAYLSGEKDILEKCKEDREKAEYLIGCYIYHDLLALKKGIKLFENSETEGKESHHSLVLSLISKKNDVSTISSNWGFGLGTPTQLEQAENSIINFAGNREPATYVIDIDGVIFKHDAGCFSDLGKFDNDSIGIDKNVAKINELYKNGCKIILLSSRPENVLSETQNALNKIGLKYSRIILGATSGIRYLINDRKPSNMALNSAVSINSIRDHEFELDHTSSIDFTKDCTKGSGASTLILKDQTNNFSFVRKWTSSSNEDISKTLYRQFSYVKLMSKYISYAVPKILDWNFGKKGISYYDMSFIDGANLSSESISKSPQLLNILCNVLSCLYDGTAKGKYENYQSLLQKIIQKKLKPTIKISSSQLEPIISNYEGILNLNLMNKMNESIDFLGQETTLWKSHSSTLIHGDLTLENIFFKNESIFLIDPLGSTMDVRANGSMKQLTSPVFDLGKLLQSLISQYETWAYLDINSINTYIRNFSVEEEKKNISENLNFLNPLIEFYSQYINENVLNDGLFSLAQILIRVAPYRIRANYNHSALVCLLKAYAILEYLKEN